MKKTDVFSKINELGVIAVIVIDQLNHAIPLAQALLSGGVSAIELTLRTPIALAAGQMIKKEVPEMLLGYGTVLTTSQVKDVQDTGADFAVAPGCNPTIIRAASEQGLPFAPGIMSPTDIEIAIQEGCRTLKFFPSETSGGLKHLQSMSAPYIHLGLQFIPLGGVNLSNAKSYLESPLISAVGGSWLAKRQLILDQEWGKIAQNAKEITDLIRNINE